MSKTSVILLETLNQAQVQEQSRPQLLRANTPSFPKQGDRQGPRERSRQRVSGTQAHCGSHSWAGRTSPGSCADTAGQSRDTAG